MATLAPPLVRITSTAGIMGGMPCVEGTRIPAETIRACLIAGEDEPEIHDSFPTLPTGGIDAVRVWARAEGRSCSAS